MLWPIHIIISNLDSKIWHSQIQLDSLSLSFISIIYKYLKDRKNKNKDLRTKIYHLALKVIPQYKNLLLI